MKIFARNFRFLAVAVFISIVFASIGCRAPREPAAKDSAAENSPQPAAEATPQPKPFALAAAELNQNKPVELGKLEWKYRAGDDPSWADPQTNDSDWQTVTPISFNKFKAGGDWNGIGWYRLRLRVDEAAANQLLSAAASHFGASEIYVDGKLVRSFGRVAAASSAETTYNPNFVPFGIVFSPPGEHVIAVRYSNTKLKNNYKQDPFELRLSRLDSALDNAFRQRDLENSINGGTFGICLAIGLLHFLLFALYPRQRFNLFYSLFLLITAGQTLLDSFVQPHAGLSLAETLVFVTLASLPIYFVSFVAYLYAALENRFPRFLRTIVLAAVIVVAAQAASSFFDNNWIALLTTAAMALAVVVLFVWHIVAILLIIVRAVRRGADSSWILGFVGFSYLASLLMAIWLGGTSVEQAAAQFGCLVCLIFANTIFLARQSARTNRNLELQLVREIEHEKEKARLVLVEAENDRRAKELEEARALQLSLLPKKLPDLPNLEIAAYMKPATEVGGDYYDFHVAADGTLTVAVGDATGHGLKAGTVVAATKSLFNAFAGGDDVPQILTASSRALKQMNLRGLFMAMTLMKIKNSRLAVSCAGMPPLLVYRRATGAVEEIALRAVPLGGISNFAYRQIEIDLAPGDLIVAMSDGFPEMFNPADETLGFDKAAEILPNVADCSPQEIINHLIETGETWANGRPQDDDVTFVVMKIKSNGKSLNTSEMSLTKREKQFFETRA